MKRENTRLTTVKLNWLESIKSNKLVSFLDYQVPGIYPRFFFIFHPVLEDSVRSPSDCCRDSLLLSFYFQTGNFSSNISRIVSKLWAIPSRFLRDSYEIPTRFLRDSSVLGIGNSIFPTRRPPPPFNRLFRPAHILPAVASTRLSFRWPRRRSASFESLSGGFLWDWRNVVYVNSSYWRKASVRIGLIHHPLNGWTNQTKKAANANKREKMPISEQKRESKREIDKENKKNSEEYSHSHFAEWLICIKCDSYCAIMLNSTNTFHMC